MGETLSVLGYGRYLGTDKVKQDFVLYKDREEVSRTPYHATDLILASDGNTLSTNALFHAGSRDIPVLVLSQTGRLISTVRPVDSDYDVEVRLRQYEAYNSPRGFEIAKAVLNAKIDRQVEFLEEHGFDATKIHANRARIGHVTAPSPEQYRARLNIIEANCSKVYFHNYITLFPEGFATNARHKYGAQDAFNNILNLCYEFLKAQCFQACYKTHLDPFLGFLHSTRHGKPAMVCDIQEFFRGEVDSFLYERQDRLGLDTVASDNGRVFLDRESVLGLMLELKDFFSESRTTRAPFGTSHKYSRQTIVKFQTRVICQYLKEENPNLIIL